MERPNLLYIKELSGGDTQFEVKLINIIKNEFPVEKEQFEKNLESKNFKETADNVHKIKHKISILGLTKSYKTATLFEKNLLEGSTNLKDEFNTTLNIITEFLKEL